MNRVLLCATIGFAFIVHIGPSLLALGAAIGLGMLAVTLHTADAVDSISIGVIVVFAVAALIATPFLMGGGVRSLRAALAPSPPPNGD
ncbi:hypothetical protein [Glycomyces paridis]|uniref:Uncharacterized protein n=1 Tax=Glycomyces paridis TaxID=2126555 RepID=A0A4S8P8K4_9ACTN|nr:hypothetical protein [Glycomyces paridis]THV25935.1 hypothetical protein E9998_19575 [Glycomyces paridis]